MGQVVALAGVSISPSRTIAKDVSPPRDYRCETSVDGTQWEAAGSGELANIAYALATQRLAFAHPRQARFLRLSFDAPALPTASIALAGIGAFTVKR